MSALPDNELDLEKLFLPAWAQEKSSTAKYEKYEVPLEQLDRRGDRRGPRPPRREGGPGPRREEGRGRGERRGPRPEGQREGRGQERDWGGNRRGDRRELVRREPPAPLPEVNIALVPDDKGVESLARQIKMTGRAYPLFDIAQMILQKPERHSVVFSVRKNETGQPVQPLFACALDDTLWLSEDEAVNHVLRKHFATFYQTEKTPAEPPKGKYTFVAQCGMSGVILGPPNHHEYQNQLRKIHAERFSRMPFDAYKSRVRIVKDEEVVKKWVEEQSWKTEFTCLNLPEPLRLPSMEAVEKHFRETHKENIIKQVESHTMIGAAARNLRSPELVRLVRSVWEDQRRFPLQIATVLSQQFAGQGLQFFKVNKTITHVCVARPHYLDLAAAPVSEGIKRIVEFIDAHPRCSRKLLVESLAPTPANPAPAPAPAPAQEGEAVGAAAAIPSPAPDQPSPEQTAVISDLHWLIHQGHVIEFANGVLETAKKPIPKPPRPEKVAKPAANKPAEQTGQEALAAAGVEVPSGETATVTGESPTAGEGTPEPQAPAQPGEETTAQAAPAPESPASAAGSLEEAGAPVEGESVAVPPQEPLPVGVENGAPSSAASEPHAPTAVPDPNHHLHS